MTANSDKGKKPSKARKGVKRLPRKMVVVSNVPELLSVKQVADRLGVSGPTVYRYLTKGHPDEAVGKLVSIKVGGTTIIQGSALRAFQRRLKQATGE